MVDLSPPLALYLRQLPLPSVSWLKLRAEDAFSFSCFSELLVTRQVGLGSGKTGTFCFQRNTIPYGLLLRRIEVFPRWNFKVVGLLSVSIMYLQFGKLRGEDVQEMRAFTFLQKFKSKRKETLLQQKECV